MEKGRSDNVGAERRRAKAPSGGATRRSAIPKGLWRCITRWTTSGLLPLLAVRGAAAGDRVGVCDPLGGPTV